MRLSKRSGIRMKQLIVYIGLCCSLNSFSQVERFDIIANKIRSIKRITHLNNDSANKEVIQTYYSKAGDDSLEFYNGVLAFRFTPTLDDKGKVSRLVRSDSKNREDEIHLYKYNKSGSYSIEKIAQGAGTISLASYDKKNQCMEEEIESSYTLVYVRNGNGKTEKILSRKDNKTETIAVFYFDTGGLPIKGEGTTEGGKTIYFKYNDRKLISETKTVGKNEEGKLESETVLI